MDLVRILVPLGICVVLPVLIVFLIIRAKINDQNKKAEVITEAIKAGKIDNVDELLSSLKTPQKSSIERLMIKLKWGCIFTIIGIGLAGFCCFMKMNNMLSDPEDLCEIIFLIICLLGVGIGFLITFFVNKKMLGKFNSENQEESV